MGKLLARGLQVAQLRVDLKDSIERVEELLVVIGEMVLRYGNPDVLDETFSKSCGHRLDEFAKIYETFCKAARKKWDMPRKSDVQ